MRRTATVLALSTALLAPAPAFAQESATPTADMFDPANCANAELSVRVNGPVTSFTNPSSGWRVTAKGNPNTTVNLRAYSRPDGPEDEFHLGQIRLGDDGNGVFRHMNGSEAVVALGHTRFTISNAYPDCAPGTDSKVGLVRNVFGPITAVRNAPFRYTFSGTVQGTEGKIVNLYRFPPGGGQTILTAQTRIVNGAWRIDRTFLGSGRFDMRVHTGDDINSGGGASPARFTVIH